jgi:response regulator RpfG family c-di-GMP phosphodiesterase
MTATFASVASPLVAKRVLVVDDERAVAAVVVRRLEREGAVCTAAHSGGEALEQLATGAFDLMVSDVLMPGRSGLELLEDAQRLAEPPAVILMAADGEMSSAAEALARGADGYLRKPLDPEQVVHDAALALELRGLRRAVEGFGVARAAGPVLVVLGEIVSAFEKADPYRAGFSARTARLAVALAAPLGLDAERLALAARVHDVGMLAVPVTEQHAQGQPSRTTHHLIRVHPTLGARWIERLGAERAVVAAVAAHHERYDGSGYPGGLAGEAIPPLARGLGTAAAVAAMSGPRPWRARRDGAGVIAQLEQGRLKQFGAAEADAVIEILRRQPELVA